MISYLLSQIVLSHHTIRNHERKKACFELSVLRISVLKMFYNYRMFYRIDEDLQIFKPPFFCLFQLSRSE